MHLNSLWFVFRLIKSGTNLEIRNARQWTALDCSAAFGWEKITRTLLEAGANIQPKGKGKVCFTLCLVNVGFFPLSPVFENYDVDIVLIKSTISIITMKSRGCKLRNKLQHK